MPRISYFYGITIRMFYADHPPPHFHAVYGGESAEIAIDTLEVIGGSLPRRSFALVLEWAALHRQELRVNWERCRRHEQTRQIAPLE